MVDHKTNQEKGKLVTVSLSVGAYQKQKQVIFLSDKLGLIYELLDSIRLASLMQVSLIPVLMFCLI